MEASNPPDAEFKTVAMRVLDELRGRAEELGENFNEETGKKMETGTGQR